MSGYKWVRGHGLGHLLLLRLGCLPRFGLRWLQELGVELAARWVIGIVVVLELGDDAPIEVREGVDRSDDV